MGVLRLSAYLVAVTLARSPGTNPSKGSQDPNKADPENPIPLNQGIWLKL